MTKHRIRLYSYHTFLVIPFIVLFLYVHNIGQTRPFMTYRTLLLGMLLTVVLFALFYFLLRNRLKTGVFVTVLLFALFQYGVFYEFFESLYYGGYWPFKNIHRYLVIGYLLVFGVFFWFIKRSPHDFIKINYFLNILICILVAYNAFRVNFASYSAGPGKTREGKTREQSVSGNLRFSPQAARPDVFYIVLDGYASNATLEKFYHFDNSDFSTSLQKLGFSFCDSAYSNYYYTSQSLAATMNLHYLADSSSATGLLRNNALFDIMKENGYRIFHMYSGYAVTSLFPAADSTIYIDGPNEFEKSLLKYTILRLDDLIGLFAHQRLNSQFRKMYDMAHISARPKLCFMHFVAPHPPYIFDREGKIRARHRFAEHSWEPKEYYIDQLIYVNKQITGLLAELCRSNPDAVIVLQSDHGPWVTASSAEEVFSARSGILYAWRSRTTLDIPQRTSSVNTFRYLVNGLFDTRLPILPDEFAGKAALLQDPILTKKISPGK
jgi:hypothetical protein